MRVDLGKVDENRKSREESINAPVSALLCKLAREPCVNTLTQAAAHFCPQIGSTWLNMVFHFKEVLHKTTLAMDTIYFAFSGANCATLAHWHTCTGPPTGRCHFQAKYGVGTVLLGQPALPQCSRGGGRGLRFILIFYFLKEPLNVDFFWSGKKLVKLPLQPRVLVLSQVASLHHFMHFHCYHYDCHHRYHHHYIVQHCGWTPVGQLRILPCYGQRNQIIYDCLHVGEDFQQK